MSLNEHRFPNSEDAAQPCKVTISCEVRIERPHIKLLACPDTGVPKLPCPGISAVEKATEADLSSTPFTSSTHKTADVTCALDSLN